MERMGFCIRLQPNVASEYKRLHNEVWPEVIQAIQRAQIRNYSIFLKEPEDLLFAYWEYHGSDFAADMAKMGDDKHILAWWEVCGPLQDPFKTRQTGEWWARMPEVFHED